MYPATRAPEVLRRYRDLAMSATDDLTIFTGLMTSPEGVPINAILVGFNGTAAAGEAAIKPLRDLGPVADQVAEMPYPALQSMLDAGFPSGLQVYWRSDFLKGLPDEAIDMLCDRFASITSPLSALLHRTVRWRGRARAGRGDGVRAAGCTVQSRGDLPLDGSVDRLDAHRLGTKIERGGRPFASGGVYVNYLGPEGADRVRAAYGSKYDKLVAVKTKYDPTNLFRTNQNIRPD